MRSDLLRRVGEAMYGSQWQTPLAADLGVSDRTMRRWAAGAPMPHLLAEDLVLLVRQRAIELRELDAALMKLLIGEG